MLKLYNFSKRVFKWLTEQSNMMLLKQGLYHEFTSLSLLCSIELLISIIRWHCLNPVEFGTIFLQWEEAQTHLMLLTKHWMIFFYIQLLIQHIHIVCN